MFYLCRNGDDYARRHLDGILAPFLIPATTTDTDEYLYCFVVDMPVVTAARLESNVYNTTANVSQITLTDEILAVRVRFAFRPFAAILFVATTVRQMLCTKVFRRFVAVW